MDGGRNGRGVLPPTGGPTSEILKAVFDSISVLIREPALDDAAPAALRAVGEVLDVDRCVVFECVERTGRPVDLIPRYQWTRAGVPFLSPEIIARSQGDPDIVSWHAPLREGKPVITTAANANPTVRALLRKLGLASILLVPIVVGGTYWGQIGLDDSKPSRQWTPPEIEMLLALAALFGMAITRGRQNQELTAAHEIIRRSPTIYYRVAAEPTMPLTYISSNIARLGYERDHMLKEPTFYSSLVHPEDRASFEENQAQALRGQPVWKLEARMRLADGTYRWFEIRRTPVMGVDGKPAAFEGELRDIDERKRAEEQLALSNALLTAATENSPDGILIVDPQQNILAFNQRFVELWGAPTDVMNARAGSLLLQFISGRTKDPAGFIARAAHIRGHPTEPTYDEIELADGRIFERHSGTLYGSDRAKPLGLIFFFRDITERQRIAEGRERANRALRMMNACDDIIIHATDESRLLNDICQAIVDVGGYRLAWIGLAQDDAERTVRPIAWAGYNREYVDEARVSWANNERGRGPIGTAIRTGHIAIMHDMATGANFGPWRDAAAKRGYRSSAALPLKIDDRIFGSLTVYTTAHNMFDLEESELLTELAADIGYAVSALRAKSARVAAEEALRHSEERFRTIFESVSDIVMLQDVESPLVVIDANPRAFEQFGYTLEELRKTGLSILFSDQSEAAKDEVVRIAQLAVKGSPQTFEWQAAAKDGRLLWLETMLRKAAFGGRAYLLSAARDITARKAAERQVAQLARIDTLTALPNRHVFVEALQQAISRVERGGKGFAILYLDLDHFKDVNDTLGHFIGDELLKAVSGRLLNSVRTTDIVARFGGDEFAVLQNDIQHPDEAATLAAHLLETIALPFNVSGNQIQAATSIGIAVNEPAKMDGETLLSHADLALYRAKSEGRGIYRFFTESMDTDVHARVRLTNELREALAAKQFFLEYQPQIQITTGRIVGVEALIRWRHPQRGVLTPGAFVEVAERSGLIVPLGRLVLTDACRQMKAWVDAGVAPEIIAVNVSANQFKWPLELEQAITSTLTETGLPPQRLEIELTETALMEKTPAQAEVLFHLRSSGIRLAIDDFGTGYSSLEYLLRLSVDRIKIAQTFIARMVDEPNAATIVRAAISLARALSIEIIAEGAETLEQIDLIKSWNCDQVQGFYYARPTTADETTTLLRIGKIEPARMARTSPDASSAPAGS